jgi:hypothetical protein
MWVSVRIRPGKSTIWVKNGRRGFVYDKSTGEFSVYEDGERILFTGSPDVIERAKETARECVEAVRRQFIREMMKSPRWGVEALDALIWGYGGVLWEVGWDHMVVYCGKAEYVKVALSAYMARSWEKKAEKLGQILSVMGSGIKAFMGEEDKEKGEEMVGGGEAGVPRRSGQKQLEIGEREKEGVR